ncbi:MAG: YciI family protein [Gammaproteobacteria bacterium]|nr:YciI family protein [Gammaproteobacteria bacterium]
MKQFMMLHFGFEKPTQEIMAAWGEWFQSIADRTVDNGGFHRGGIEYNHDGRKELPFAPDSITGYSIINAESLDEAEELARANPFVASIRVYEIVRQ